MAWVWYWDAEPAVPCTKINGRTRSSGMSGMDGPGSRPLPELEPEPLRQPASSVAMPSPRTSPAPRRYAVLLIKYPLLVVIRLESSSRMILNAEAPLCKQQKCIITIVRCRMACDRLGAGQNRRRDGLGKNNRGGETRVATLPATPRHTTVPLRLLPSGPDRVHGESLRGDRQGRHNEPD